jgi:protein-tyrosine phosphatase
MPDAVDANGTLAKRIIRPLLPKALLRNRGIIVRLGPKAGRIYARLRLLDALGMRAENKKLVPPSARSFVFVCFGNIMRSPMAAALFQRAATAHGLLGLSIASAGIHASPGTAAHPRAQIAAQCLGLPLDHHRSRLLTPEGVAQADAIFVMDFQNKAELLASYPEAWNRIFMMSAYGEGKLRYREIPDPYFGDQQECIRCYAVLNTCAQNLARSLSQRAMNDAVPEVAALGGTVDRR